LSQKSNNIKNEVKAMLASQGWKLTEGVNKMNERHPEQKKTTVQNISNKLTRGTIKYSEIHEIANIIGKEIKWI